METQNKTAAPGGEPEPGKSGGGSNVLTIVLGGALAVAVIVIIFLLIFFVFGQDSGSESGQGGDNGEGLLPPPGVTVEATIIPPTPEAGDPTATVIATAGVNLRTGPGLNYSVVGTAPYLSTLEVVGASEDGTWWVVNVPGAPNNYGWVAEEFVDVENGEEAIVIAIPPTPTPAATATTTATPAPDISFSADRTVINAGESATLSWSVENIKAVYVYPVGDNFYNYPAVGQDSRNVQPFITTTYELLTINPDDSTSQSRIEITVVSGLTTGRWLLQTYRSPGSGPQNLLPGTEITARFGADGSLSGSAGCNSYNGGFMAYDQTLRTSDLTASRSFCADPDGIMEQEEAYLSALRQATRMQISAGQLTVFNSAGDPLLIFRSG